MKRSVLLSCALSLAAGLFVANLAPAELPAERVLAPAPQDPTCKPDAPIRLELQPRHLIGGRARVDYVVTPVMDALAIEVSVAFPRGGNLSWHTPPSSAAAARGVVRQGSLAAELPLDLPGVELEVRAHISIPDPDAPDGIGFYTTTRTVEWGEVDRSVGGVTEILSGGELTLDTAATRL